MSRTPSCGPTPYIDSRSFSISPSTPRARLSSRKRGERLPSRRASTIGETRSRSPASVSSERRAAKCIELRAAFDQRRHAQIVDHPLRADRRRETWRANRRASSSISVLRAMRGCSRANGNGCIAARLPRENLAIDHGAVRQRRAERGDFGKALGDQILAARPQPHAAAALDELRANAVPLPFDQPIRRRRRASPDRPAADARERTDRASRGRFRAACRGVARRRCVSGAISRR